MTKLSNFSIKHLFILTFALLALNCQPPEVQAFNHSRTLFPLKAGHFGVDCRECHKDGAITSLPTACLSCHPMPYQHTKNTGDCDICHTQATFSAAYYNHARSGLVITGGHKALIADDCFYCHLPETYTGITFICYECHQPSSIDGIVHISTTDSCENCHGQSNWTPARFSAHSGYAIKLGGAHSGLRCSTCHTTTFGTLTQWQAPNLRYSSNDGDLLLECVDCHRSDYDFGESDHNGLPADDDCGRCHGYSTFDD